MASNFRIFFHRNSENLHLKLIGDFDGSSAHQLINLLKEQNGNMRKIFIHTCNLSSIDPFGLDVFQKSFSVNKLSGRLTFTGEHSDKIAPAGSRLA
jgi:anti-anti-sigma regulatory factor